MSPKLPGVRHQDAVRALKKAGYETVRQGWAEAAKQLRERDDNGLVDAPTPTRFDDEEWHNSP